MRRVGWLLALLALGLLAGAASAQSNAAFNGLCSSGGRNAIVQGLNSTNYLSGIVPKCTITVYLTGTTTPATIFANAGGTPLANPFTANALGSAAPGSWLFFAATGQGYDVVMSGGIAPNTFPLPVTLTDLQAGGGGGTGCIPSGTGILQISNGSGGCSGTPSDYGITSANSFTFAPPTGNFDVVTALDDISFKAGSGTGTCATCDYSVLADRDVTEQAYTGDVNIQAGHTSSTTTSSLNLEGNEASLLADNGDLNIAQHGSSNVINMFSAGDTNIDATGHVALASVDITNPGSGSSALCINSSGQMGTFGCSGGSSVTWPTSTDLVISNSTNTPAGLAVVNGDCVVGSGGAWVAGSCAGTSSGTNVSVNGGSSLSAANFNATTPAAPTNGINATWQISGSTVSAAIVGDGNAAHFLNGTGAFSAPSGSGTVTSVSFTGGLISVATATTTPALTVAGTSGGIPYFSGAATWASSAALPSGDFVLGGGAGSAPTASFSIVTAAKGGTGIANTATLTLGTSNQNWATLGTGIVKNTTTTGALTNAASSDVIGLWTGSCSSSTFLRGDGACATASGSTGISGLTAGYIPLAGSSTTITANSHIDDGVTTAATLTASEPLAVTGAPGIIMAHASAASGVAGSVVYTVDPTNGYGEMNQNNAGLERIAGWNTANVFTANQTAPSWIASGSGAGSLVLTNGTAPSAVSSSVQLIAPTTVTTGYNFTFPAGAPGSTLNQMIQCSGASSALCAFAPLEVIGGSFPTGACSGNYFVNTTADGYSSYCNGSTYLNTPPGSSGLAAPLIAGQVSGNYYGYSVNNTLVAGNMLGFFADSTNTDTSVYVNVRTGGGFKVKVNNGIAIFYSSAAGIAANTFQTATIYSAAGTPIPTCNSGSHGSIGVVSDATIPTYLGTYTSGGAVEAVVECNGTNWITQ